MPNEDGGGFRSGSIPSEESPRLIPGQGITHHLRSSVSVLRPKNQAFPLSETNYVPFNFEDGPTVVTICDLSLVKHPQWHPKDRVKYFEKYFLKQLPQAEAIITISEFSKKEIIDLLNLNAERVYVTALGVDRNFNPGDSQLKGLPSRYILFLGNLEPRKNLRTLLAAFRSLPREVQNIYHLVIAGAEAWHTREFKGEFHNLDENGKVILTGYFPQKFLPDLYRGASLFVYPSFYEGFGLPVLEAMASGVPVIASNTTSLPEVVGDAGVVVNPHDVDELRGAMVRILDNEKMGKKLAEKGSKS
jgi:alpha-1,3-rhamnosyl/mannosyltransferase